MQFDAALQTACTIRDHYPRLDVIAIGRFVDSESIDTTPEDWGISVRIDRSERRTVIWTDDQLLPYSTPVAQQSGQRTPTTRRRPAMQEATLF